MRATATCPGCGEPMSPAHVFCTSCLAKLPTSYRMAMNRAYRTFAHTFDAADKAAYEAECRAAAVKVKAILDGSDARSRRKS